MGEGVMLQSAKLQPFRRPADYNYFSPPSQTQKCFECNDGTGERWNCPPAPNLALEFPKQARQPAVPGSWAGPCPSALSCFGSTPADLGLRLVARHAPSPARVDPSAGPRGVFLMGSVLVPGWPCRQFSRYSVHTSCPSDTSGVGT
ncbi:hypothetical protein ASPBRDRAFT_445417 [Aspergillus brasiliensis CBS 101740]|uniref:Uncharacterized protein n=1 Tax=Aspergillus brasiliensis (strain CBS 101740 / IMI 381727 / IBT 21946) TaxID=767769 RepID=A0A1L9URF9_ASPBC|nr:hypothetical protein ASPBRDRAFT_445417 [Aspergillus brasiliensis CBS 101740]